MLRSLQLNASYFTDENITTDPQDVHYDTNDKDMSQIYTTEWTIEYAVPRE